MYGYRLEKPSALPKVVWACKTRVERYCWKNTNKPNMLEFSICRAQRREVIFSGRRAESVDGTAFACIVGDEACESYADDGVTVEIASVAVEFGGLAYTKCEFDLEDIADESVILLPCLPSGMSEQVLTLIENLLYRIIEAYKEHSSSAELLCASAVLSLMCELDRAVRLSVKAKRDKYIHYYADKAESVLRGRYSERITVKSIAAELDITPNYLSAIFKEAKGIGLTDRLLEIRMKKAAELLARGELSVSEIAASVGYDDAGHFRRRFKQYFGVSIRDYCCINRELTLYHKKPQRQAEE